MALIEFYGKECPHCVTMEPLIAQLEKELGVTVERREAWHDQQNAELLSQKDRGRCGGVPFFVNTETDAFICGEATLEELKKWAG